MRMYFIIFHVVLYRDIRSLKYDVSRLCSLMLLWESGQFPYWTNKVVPQSPKCFIKENPRNNVSRQVPIQLKDLMSAFFILGVGLSLATFVFIVEKIIHFRVRRTLITCWWPIINQIPASSCLLSSLVSAIQNSFPLPLFLVNPCICNYL